MFIPLVGALRKIFSLEAATPFVALLLLFAPPAYADRNVLWSIVHGQCVPHFEAGERPPAPCDSVDLAGGADRGFALLKDLVGVAQLLAIPTRRLSGIEGPALLAPDAPDYFADAWTGRARVEAHLGQALPREAVGVAVNSMFSRSQDELHLHVDCIDKDVAAAHEAYSQNLDEQWRPMTVALKGRRYWARRLESADLTDASPFRLLADGIAGARQEMGLWSLAAVGADFSGRPGFILLADRAELTSGGHAEDVQDHTCEIVRRKS
jgi:CDP-diacylglycerol pyrophosphatase